MAQVADAWGQVDILVSNAGVGFGSAVLEENDDKAWGANYAVNVRGWMNSKPIPFKSARMPDAGAFRRIASGSAEVDALENRGLHSGKNRAELRAHRGLAAQKLWCADKIVSITKRLKESNNGILGFRRKNPQYL